MNYKYSNAIYNNFKSRIDQGLVLFSSGLIFFTQSALDPEMHHDGIMYVSAVGVSSGLVPNRDFFSQYGPVMPLLQGTVLRIFGNQLINLRYMTCIILIVTSVLIYFNIRKYVSRRLSIIIPIFWSLSAPSWILATNTPWSSAVSTMIILIAITLFEYGRKSIWMVTLLLVISSLIRIQSILILVLVGVVISIPKYSQNFKARNAYLSWSFFWILFTFLIFDILKMMPDFVSENIKWSFLNYAPVTFASNTTGKVKLLELAVFPISLFFLYILTQKNRGFTSKSFDFINFRLRVLPNIAIFILISILLVFGLIYKTNSSFHNPYYILQYLSRVAVSSPNFALCMLSFISIPILLFRRKLESIPKNDVLKLFVAMGLCAQLYPQWDQLHVWWLTPVFIVASVPILRTFLQNGNLSGNKIVSILSIFCLALSINVIKEISGEKYKFQDFSLSGMKSSQDNSQNLDQTLALLSRYREKSIVFDCSHGLYAAAGGRYLSAEHSYVSWGRNKDIQKFELPRYIFTCDKTHKQILDFNANQGYGLVFEINTSNGNQNALIRKIE
jgi:hypothetical protein